MSNRAFIFHDGGREIGVRDTIGHPSLLSFIGEGDQHNGRLEKQSRRCDEQPAWCGRTDVFKPALDDFRVALHVLQDEMVELNSRDHNDGNGFASIRQWCRAQ